jgi:hypothetical protein
MQTADQLATKFGLPTKQQQTMYMIVYSESAEEDLLAILDAVGVAGFTQTSRVLGRGPRGRHFDTQVWPGADGMIYTVVTQQQSDVLGPTLMNLSQRLEAESNGMHGLRVFTWPCTQQV